MKPFALVTLALISIPTLAAPPRAANPIIKLNTESEYYLRPAKGEAATAEIGEPLYEEGLKRLNRTYRARLEADVQAALDNGFKLALKRGNQADVMARPGQDANMVCFPTTAGAFKSFFAGGTVIACLVDADNDLTFDHAEFAGYAKRYPLSAPTPYTVKVSETRSVDQDSLQVQVLYQGLSKGEVRFSFREFKDGLARPAFTQDIAYELRPDGRAEVGFKGMRMVVTAASSTQVQYVLEQPVAAMAPYRAEAAAPTEAKANAWWKRAAASAD